MVERDQVRVTLEPRVLRLVTGPGAVRPGQPEPGGIRTIRTGCGIGTGRTGCGIGTGRTGRGIRTGRWVLTGVRAAFEDPPEGREVPSDVVEHPIEQDP